MAARLEPAPAVRIPDLVDLRKISSAHLDTLLEEETREWNEALDWDFRKSADLVCRFVDLRALSGCALMDQGEAVGYSYFVLEDQKGLIGDLYVRPRYRTAENENRLLYAVLEGLVTGSQVRRIVLIEAGLIGLSGYVIGAACGLALAALLVFVINRQFFGWSIRMVLDPWIFLQAFALVAVTSLLAGLWPAHHAAGRAPAEAMRLD